MQQIKFFIPTGRSPAEERAIVAHMETLKTLIQKVEG
jgi:hypothetical protein